MARNDLPTNASQLIILGNNMLGGLTSLGTTLHITQITPTRFQTELNAFIAADGAFNAARSAQQTASDGFKETDGIMTSRLQIMRNVLAGRFGNRWNTQWAQAGFIDHSTSLPTRIDERIGLALSLAGFFTANPSFEVASMNVTAEEAQALYDEANATRQVYSNATMALKTKGDADASAQETLMATMRALIKILGATLGKDDPRWLAFGLNIPATDTTPGKPVNVTAALDETGAIVVGCDATPLATRYRWRTLIVGLQTEYKLAASSVDPMASITGVAPGQTAQIIVQAVNNGLQGVASDPIEFAVPVAKAAPKSAVETPAPKEPAVANGNGHGNGHALHSRAA